MIAEPTTAPSSSSSTSSSTTSTPPPPDSHISPTTSLTYWSQIPTSISGMLGGYPQVSRIDIQGSRSFLAKLRRLHPLPPPPSSSSQSSPDPGTPYTLTADCGAGIGRITLSLLLPLSATIDIIEPIPKFTTALLASIPATLRPRVGEIHNLGLESWHPPAHKRYDLIWNQWCLGHLTDAQLTAYLARISHRLSSGGWIVVKENVAGTSDGHDIFDAEDSSVTRSEEKWAEVFARAGLRVGRSEVQRGFARELGLFGVVMWALRPVAEGEGERGREIE